METETSTGSGGKVVEFFSDPSKRREYLEDPYPFWEQFRRPGLVKVDGYWTLTTSADVSKALRDRRLGMAAANEFRRPFLGSGPAMRLTDRWMLFSDPPEHTRLRALVSKVFTPRAVEAMRPRVQAIVDDLLAPVWEAGSMDVMGDLAYPLPTLVICEMLGVPGGDRTTFKAWTRDLFPAIDMYLIVQPDLVARADTAAEALKDYFLSLVAERRRHQRPDLLSRLLAAEEEDDRLTEEEVVQTAVLLLIAGYETTMGLIGNMVLALLRDPDQLGLLRATPSLIKNAVEECLRYDSPVIFTGRMATEDVEIESVTVPKGELVSLAILAANRDPARYRDPNRLDITRADIEPLSFGGGIHYCLGAPLARLETEIAIATILRRARTLELDASPFEWIDSGLNRILKRLPVEVRG